MSERAERENSTFSSGSKLVKVPVSVIPTTKNGNFFVSKIIVISVLTTPTSMNISKESLRYTVFEYLNQMTVTVDNITRD